MEKNNEVDKIVSLNHNISVCERKSITISGISSKNSNFFLNQSQKSSFLYQSNIKGKNLNNGNNNNLKMDEVPEANAGYECRLLRGVSSDRNSSSQTVLCRAEAGRD